MLLFRNHLQVAWCSCDHVIYVPNEFPGMFCSILQVHVSWSPGWGVQNGLRVCLPPPIRSGGLLVLASGFLFPWIVQHPFLYGDAVVVLSGKNSYNQQNPKGIQAPTYAACKSLRPGPRARVPTPVDTAFQNPEAPIQVRPDCRRHSP